ncbi:hypothetical protein CARUB_v10002638mg [Capsella rubella]|uniref:Knottin scorpion toxin-like domain-containing protein n=1 Tax=Capsella rubella TaxID=81985 RepID=R0H4G7_9BRAS|nr:hypothetical protein CARUB_v10002638mg [Capsella rubella]
MKTKFIFSLGVLALYILFVLGVVGDGQKKTPTKQTWCSRPFPNNNQKTEKCVIKDCESKCRQKWKGNGTEASCRPRCICHFRCPWIQGSA